MHPKLGICFWSIPAPDDASKIAFASELGFKGLELGLERLENGGLNFEQPKTVEQFKAWSTQHGFTYTTLGINECCGVAITNPAEHKYLLDLIQRATAIAKQLEIRVLQIPSFFASDIKDANGFGATVSFFREASAIAESESILIASENALDRPNQQLLFQSIPAANFRSYFDTANPMWMKGLDASELLHDAYERTVEVHLKDMFRDDRPALLGQGETDFKKSAAILQAKTYSGWMHLENDYKSLAKTLNRSPEDLVREDIRYVESLF